MAARPGGIQTAAGYAELLADADRPGGYVLLVDRIRQSYVDLSDPTYLDFEYMRHLADVLDALPPGSLAVTHVGGGAMTLARYVAATRPKSPQLVLEPDAALTAFVRAQLPLPADAWVRVRAIEGRRGVAELKDASADVVILDAFAGGRVPAALGTLEFLMDVARVLRPGGVLLANVADGPPLRYARRFASTLSRIWPDVALMTDTAVARGRRYGNLELAAAASGTLPVAVLARAAAAGAFPVRFMTGPSLARFLAGAPPLTDADSMRSMAPPEHSWRVRLD